MQNKKCIDSINQEVKVKLKNNQEDERLKEQLEKEYNSIKIPSGLKEELWTQISTTRKKRRIYSKIFPFMAVATFIIILIPLGLSLISSDSARNPSDSIAAKEEADIRTIEAVIKNNFTGPDEKWLRLMNNTSSVEEGEIKGLSEYEEGLYKEYFASDRAYVEYVSRYGSVVWNEPARYHYTLRVLEINCEKTSSDEIIYNFSAKIEYRKQDSNTAEVGTITGQANLNEEHKIEVMLINYFDLINEFE